ncbi:uncharacterized protein LOC119190840 [Manduca sexta]|uniref:Uncharacterized protein n=1 Tax=Manduca sexta TaxID=7130 RepID=A0A921YPQ3_MANSE|nr:uncharacterized protein LOC119190840 [Manduca sexta]KAG6443172.1 hypothetical protein O3G_MSEX002715 [Manduca sexta]
MSIIIALNCQCTDVRPNGACINRRATRPAAFLSHYLWPWHYILSHTSLFPLGYQISINTSASAPDDESPEAYKKIIMLIVQTNMLPFESLEFPQKCLICQELDLTEMVFLCVACTFIILLLMQTCRIISYGSEDVTL